MFFIYMISSLFRRGSQPQQQADSSTPVSTGAFNVFLKDTVMVGFFAIQPQSAFSNVPKLMADIIGLCIFFAIIVILVLRTECNIFELVDSCCFILAVTGLAVFKWNSYHTHCLGT